MSLSLVDLFLIKAVVERLAPEPLRPPTVLLCDSCRTPIHWAVGPTGSFLIHARTASYYCEAGAQ